MTTLTINGTSREVDVTPEMPLLWVLRDVIGLTGTKFGCGIAACGACTVHLDGQPIRSCVTPVAAVAGKQITTVEDRVVCAVDCGTIVNPDIVKAQIEGGIAFGISGALSGEITLKNGRVEQSNFTDYRVLRMNETPAIEVHLVRNGEAPGGIGELGTAVTAPALANAVFAATGKRQRQLPLRPGSVA